jgi:uncharacterized protein
MEGFMKSNKVVIIAGGGVFGAIPAKFLSNSICKDIYREVDAFGGASVGSQIAAANAIGMNTLYFYNEFMQNVNDVFQKRKWFQPPTIFGAWYKDTKLNENLTRLFNQPLDQVGKILIVPTFCFKTHKVKVYDNITFNDDMNVKLWEVCRQSSSAPVYLPVYNWFIDGGLIENIPIMTTLSALSKKANWDWKNTDVLALGTGFKEVETDLSLSRINNWWISVNWLPHLLSFLTKTNEAASVFWANNLVSTGLLKSFTFFNPVKLDKNWQLDSAESAIEASNRADQYMEQFQKIYTNFIEK